MSKPHTKSVPKTMLIWLNGEQIRGGTATEKFVKTLEMIGLERIANFKFELSGAPLVTRGASSEARTARCIGVWSIATHSSTAEKHSLLESIAARMQVDLRVKVQSSNEVLYD